MGLAKSGVEGVLGHLTTDQAVRAGVTTAAWSFAASNARGLTPRTPVQQAAATGVIMAAHYEIGTAMWSVIAGTAAGAPGSRAGNRALLTAAALSAGGGKLFERQLRPHSGDNVWLGAAWSQAKLLSVVGLAGGLVTASDIVIHDVLLLPRTPATTLALDLTMGGAMAGGTWARRRRRGRRFSAAATATPQAAQSEQDADAGPTPESPPATRAPAAKQGKKRKGGQRKAVIRRVKTGAYAGGAVVGTTVGVGVLALLEQAGARLVSRGLATAVGEDLEEFGEAVGHSVMFSAFAVGGLFGLNALRNRIEGGAGKKQDPGYIEEPDSPFVSAGPLSAVDYQAIGREGRRFVIMRLSRAEIESLMGEPAVDPVRVVVPRSGSIAERAQLALSELISTGGLDRSLICVAAPTGVGYVNYVMAEALEYLTRGDCAIVVPQYAYVPSLLALNKTAEATDLQVAVIAAIRSELIERGRDARVVQFGESLGAQVAADVGGVRGAAGFDESGLSEGLYLGIPFRSSLWRSYLRNPEAITGSGRVVVVPDARELTAGQGRHVLVSHDDDPITKFAWTMVVQRPWWMGPAETRPPKVPRETYFRPITSFVLGLIDGLNGMNTRPGVFQRIGHDYRADMREAVQKAYALSVTPQQERLIEDALQAREHEWAAYRVIAREGENAARNVREKFNAWGRSSVNLELDELPGDDAGYRLVVDYLNKRLRSKTALDPAEPPEAPAADGEQ